MKIHRCQCFYVPVIFYMYREIGEYGSWRWEEAWVELNLLHVLKFLISCSFDLLLHHQRYLEASTCGAPCPVITPQRGARPEVDLATWAAGRWPPLLVLLYPSLYLQMWVITLSVPIPEAAVFQQHNVQKNTFKYEFLFDIIYHYINLTLDNVLPLEPGETCTSHYMSPNPRENYNVFWKTHLSPPRTLEYPPPFPCLPSTLLWKTVEVFMCFTFLRVLHHLSNINHLWRTQHKLVMALRYYVGPMVFIISLFPPHCFP